ncbi:MAG: hypothetical protein HDR17_06405 [Lachnospiraceae bacterium]|nr:hypothetical protein [Lachnospiraceae bacterium]
MLKEIRFTACVLVLSMLITACGVFPSEQEAGNTVSDIKGQAKTSEEGGTLSENSEEGARVSETEAGELSSETDEDKGQKSDSAQEEDTEPLPDDYVAYCMGRAQESQETMDAIRDRARENVYYLLKAYEESEKREYTGQASSDEIFSDQVVDSICGGNSVAKKAVVTAIDCFENGDSLSDTFGAAMDAAVREIPGVVQEKFLDCLCGGYLSKAVNFYETLEDSSDAQVNYAISLLQTKMGDSVDELVFLLSTEELTGEELKECAYLITEIYALVQELDERFSLNMPSEEWRILSMLIAADDWGYRYSEMRRNLYMDYAEADPAKLQAFLEDADHNAGKLQEFTLWLADDYELEFLSVYERYLALRDDCLTLRTLDYAQLAEDSQSNMILGTVSSLFGNFLTDMLAAEEVRSDNDAVYALYQFMGTCQCALDAHRGGIDGYEQIRDHMNMMYTELMDAATAEKYKNSETDQMYQWFIFDDFYGESGTINIEAYREWLDECSAEVLAYETLLNSYIAGAQYMLLRMDYEVNSNYIERLRGEVTTLSQSLGGLSYQGEMADTSAEETAVVEGFALAAEQLLKYESRIADVEIMTKSVTVDGLGKCTLRTCVKTEMDENGYLWVAPFYTTLTQGNKELVRMYTLSEGPCRLVLDGTKYVNYGTDYNADGTLVRCVASTNIEDLDNANNVWEGSDTTDLEVCNDYYAYAYWAIYSMEQAVRSPSEKERELESALKIILQMRDKLPGEPEITFGW